MGYMRHSVTVATVYELAATVSPKIEALRESMPIGLRELLVGPIPAAVNGYDTWVFAPDGGNEGRDTSDTVDEWREKFVAIFKDEPLVDVVDILFGGGGGPARIVSDSE